MRCRQLLSLSVTLATLLVLVKCENNVNTTPAPEKGSGDQTKNVKVTADNSAITGTTSLSSSLAGKVQTITDPTTHLTPKPTEGHPISTTAPKVDGNTNAKAENTTAATLAGTTNVTTVAGTTNATTFKPTVRIITTTLKPQNSTSSALTALSAVTLCVLSLTVSL